MASINDLFNQLVTANGTLNQINTDVVAGTNATNQVKTSVDNVDTDVKTLDGDVKAGFAATVNALNILAQIDTEVVRLLFHLTQQTDTVICALEHISKNTCELLNQAAIQTRLQTRIRDDADVLRDIAESAHPAAALERHRLAELRAEIERCCPPEQPQPPCTYEPCPKPEPICLPQLPGVGGQPTRGARA
jgi:hypothetical protein